MSSVPGAVSKNNNDSIITTVSNHPEYLGRAFLIGAIASTIFFTQYVSASLTILGFTCYFFSNVSVLGEIVGLTIIRGIAEIMLME